jgi:hypothetical protein
LQLYGISTYDDALSKNGKELKEWFEKCKTSAEQMRLDGWGFTHMNYSASDAILTNFFDKGGLSAR